MGIIAEVSNFDQNIKKVVLMRLAIDFLLEVKMGS
jgi:hypothetical protein